jgi:predicted neuraminidase
MRYEHVFGDLRSFSQCHAATLVGREGGGLLVAWFGGTREGHRDTAIWASDRIGNSNSSPATADSADGIWSEPRVIANTIDEAHWNPVLFPLSATDLILHFKVGMRIRDWTTWSQRSVDAGATWDDPKPLVRGDRGGRGAVKNKPIRLESNEWLAGASTESWRRWDAFVDRSPNGIDGWQASKRIAIDRGALKGKGIIQPSLWQSSDRDVHALLRSTEGVIYRSDSKDGGLNWSTARPTAVPNNNSGIDVARMQNGILALACNPVEGNWAARSPLSILFSRDNGETWPERLDVETGPGEFSYPALIGDEDGLCLAFTWNRRRIAVVRIQGSELPAL